MNLVNKGHFILVDLQAKSQTSIDVTDRDLLDRAGFRPVPRHEIVKEKTEEELQKVKWKPEESSGVHIGVHQSKSMEILTGNGVGLGAKSSDSTELY